MKDEKRSNVLTHEENVVRGMAITFNTLSNDLGGFREIISPEAINQDLINRSNVVAVVEHDINKGILARSRNGKGTLNLELKDNGLEYSFELPNTTLGNDTKESLRRGDLDSSSFCFRCEEDEWENRDGEYIRTVKKISKLSDVSIVCNPAYNESYVGMAHRSLDTFKEHEINKIELVEYFKELRSKI